MEWSDDAFSQVESTQSPLRCLWISHPKHATPKQAGNEVADISLAVNQQFREGGEDGSNNLPQPHVTPPRVLSDSSLQSVWRWVRRSVGPVESE